MKSALAIQCLPLAGGDKQQRYGLVDRAIEAIASSGLPYTVGPMETVVEGDMEQLFDVARKAHKAILEAGAPSVATYMKLFSSPTLGSSEEKVRKYRDHGH